MDYIILYTLWISVNFFQGKPFVINLRVSFCTIFSIKKLVGHLSKSNFSENFVLLKVKIYSFESRKIFLTQIPIVFKVFKIIIY